LYINGLWAAQWSCAGVIPGISKTAFSGITTGKFDFLLLNFSADQAGHRSPAELLQQAHPIAKAAPA
jgi:hypothetical protein